MCAVGNGLVRCDYCRDIIEQPRRNQRFCCEDHRHAYHRAQFQLHRQDRERNAISEAASILGRLGGIATARKRRLDREADM